MKKSYLSVHFILVILFLVSCGSGGGGGTGGNTSPGTATGTATLTWVQQNQYADSTTLTDLGGFKIYYGTAPGVYTQTKLLPAPPSLTSPTTFRAQVTNLPVGATYYFVVRSYSQAGVESDLSAELNKTIN